VAFGHSLMVAGKICQFLRLKIFAKNAMGDNRGLGIFSLFLSPLRVLGF
jgi:hypothetical protein